MDGSAVSGLEALLERHHVDLTGDEVLAVLDSAFAAIPGSGAAPVSAAEVEFLRAHAGPGAEAVIDNWSGDSERQARAQVAVRELGDALSASMSIKQAAAVLQVDRSRVSRRITGNALWAFDIHGSRRIPRWQFLESDLLPGLETIVPAIPDGVTPITVETFMRTPRPDFGDQAPIEYLAAGGDARLVADFMPALSHW
jgi:hypothetical protein